LVLALVARGHQSPQPRKKNWRNPSFSALPYICVWEDDFFSFATRNGDTVKKT
jgi:hypothetical protein